MPTTKPPIDVEQLLVDEILAKVEPPEGFQMTVDVEEPTPRPDGYLVIVRGDGHDALGLGMFDSQYGIRIIGPVADVRGKATGSLASTIHQVIALMPRPETPVAAVPSQSGPYRAPKSDPLRPEWYQTGTLRTVSR